MESDIVNVEPNATDILFTEYTLDQERGREGGGEVVGI